MNAPFRPLLNEPTCEDAFRHYVITVDTVLYGISKRIPVAVDVPLLAGPCNLHLLTYVSYCYSLRLDSVVSVAL